MPFWVYRQLLQLIDHPIHTLIVTRIQNHCIHPPLYQDFTLSLTDDIGTSLHIIIYRLQDGKSF